MHNVWKDIRHRIKANLYVRREALRLMVRQSATWQRILLAVEMPGRSYVKIGDEWYEYEATNPRRGDAETGQVVVTWSSADSMHDLDRTARNVTATVPPEDKVDVDSLGGIFD